jgi:hypothetical protein
LLIILVFKKVKILEDALIDAKKKSNMSAFGGLSEATERGGGAVSPTTTGMPPYNNTRRDSDTLNGFK